jgi:hypothetical protein
VDESTEINDKIKYTRLIRAQLSSHELVIIFYSCLSTKGREKFKPLIEKYKLFDDFPDNLLIAIEHKQEYTQSAYT